MSKSEETITLIFCVVAAILLGHDSLRVSLGIGLLGSCMGIWAKEICRAIRETRSNQ